MEFFPAGAARLQCSAESMQNTNAAINEGSRHAAMVGRVGERCVEGDLS